MPRLVWDRPEDRTYEIGVDHGVLYVADDQGVMKGVPWNGLTEVKKKKTRKTESTYFDGVKIHDYFEQTQFEGEISAVTYPDALDDLGGAIELKCGISLGEQPPGLFGLCYRSMVGDAAGDEENYKLHILFNLHATPSDKTYSSHGKAPKLMEFAWDVESIPEPVRNARPTAEIVLDSRKVDPWLLEDIENMLYGTPMTDAYLPAMTDLVQFIDDWFRVKITIVNPLAVPGDADYGLFIAEEGRDGTYISVQEDGYFELTGVNAYTFTGPVDFEGIYEGGWEEDPTTWEEVWYFLTDTICQGDVPQITITDNGDGTWTAQTDYDNLIFVNEDEEDESFGAFIIRNATLIWESDVAYRITDTLPD